MAVGGAAVAIAALGLGLSISPSQAIQVEDKSVKVVDLVDIGSDASVLALVGDKVVLTIPDGDSSVDLSADDLKALLVRRIPGLSVDDIEVPNETIRIERSDKTAEQDNSPARRYWAPTVSTATHVEQGAPLTLEVRAGPILIQRPVSALQASEVGARLFVETEEKQALLVRLITETQVQPVKD